MTVPSASTAPFETTAEPRWVSVTTYPSVVVIDTTKPLEGTVPTNETRPAAAERTSSPRRPPMSSPRCSPAAYGFGPKLNGRSTSPSVGHDHAPAFAGSTNPTARTAAATHPLLDLGAHRLVIAVVSSLSATAGVTSS
jgi:hypothetical protein